MNTAKCSTGLFDSNAQREVEDATWNPQKQVTDHSLKNVNKLSF